MSLQRVSGFKSFGGEQLQFTHDSTVLSCQMRFSIFLPSRARHAKVPVLYWLSGLTCSDENFVQKAGAQQYAERHGVAIVAPDTSPRGEGVPDDAEGAYDFGLGAGFYVNATAEPWRKHYQMYDYIDQELPALVAASFPVDDSRASIFGHSMGGHGALVLALRNPGRYRSVSAFSPICSPLNCAWGEKALSGYLGADKASWKLYDASELIRSAKEKLPMLIDQGTEDQFLVSQLKPELLLGAARESDYPLDFHYRAGYDHSYFFIASFVAEHIAFHARALGI